MEYRHKDVEDVEESDEDQEDPDGNALPSIVDAQAEQKNANDELDHCRHDNVSDLTCPLEDQGLGSFILWDMFHMSSKSMGHTEDHKGAEGALKELVSRCSISMSSTGKQNKQYSHM